MLLRNVFREMACPTRPAPTRSPSVLVLLAAAILLGPGAPLTFGQALTGTISGSVADADGLALPGVTVAITSPQMIREQQVATTGPEGQYRFPNLAPGTYAVTFELEGFSTLRREDLALRAGATATADAQLKVAGLETAVTVSADSALLDVKGSQNLETLSQSMIENIPTSRTYVDLYHRIAGVEDGQYREITPGASSVNGGSSKDTQTNLEGANISSAVLGYPSTDISYEIIQEVQVVTGGIPAEFGGGSSGVINIVTKSGGNDLSGNGYYFLANAALQGNNISGELQDQGVMRPQELEEDRNGGITLGGPVLRNRLWFFGNYDRKDIEENRINFPVAISGRQNMLFGKVTSQLTDSHRVAAFYQYRKRTDYPFIPQSILIDDSAYRSQDVTNDIFTGTWTGIFGRNIVAELKGSFNTLERFQDFPNAAADPVGYEDSATREIFGGWYRDVVQPGFRNTRQLKADVSYFASDLLGGSHEFKVGAQYDLRYADEIRAWEGGARLHELFNGAPFRIVLGNHPVTLRGNTGTTAVYAQDQWSAGDKLTLNVGVRFEKQNLWIPEGFAGGVNVERRVFPKEDLVGIETWSPRLGATYDLFGDQKTVVKASFGRYYSPIFPFQFSSVAKFAEGSLTYEWNDRNRDLVFQPGEEGTLLRDTTEAEAFGVDPNLRAPYWRTVTVGVDQELRANLRLSVVGVFRKELDQVETIDTAFPFDEAYIPVALANPVTGDDISVYALDPAFRGVPSTFLVTNPGASLCSFCPDLVRQYKGLQVTLEKRMQDRWQLYGSYVLSSSEGNKGTHHRTWQSALFSDPNNLVNAFGDTTLDRTHSVKLQGTYQAPYDVWLSLSYTGQSGIPLQRDRGVLGPLARFSREDSSQIVVEGAIDVLALPPGEQRLPARHLVEARVEKRFRIGESELGLLLDIRNVTNAAYPTFLEDVLLGDSAFGLPGELVFPRTFRVGARFEF